MAILKNLKQEEEARNIKLEMVFSKSTKGTHVYEAKATGKPPAVTSLYIQRWAVAGDPPASITVTIVPENPK